MPSGEALACALSLLCPYANLRARAQECLARVDLSALPEAPSLLCILVDGSLQPPASRAAAAHALLPAISGITGVLGSSTPCTATAAPCRWNGLATLSGCVRCGVIGSQNNETIRTNQAISRPVRMARILRSG